MNQQTFLLAIKESQKFEWLMEFCYGYKTRPTTSKLLGDKFLHHHVYKQAIALKYGGHERESDAWLLHFAIWVQACIWKPAMSINYPFRAPKQVGRYEKLVVSPTVSYPFPKHQDDKLNDIEGEVSLEIDRVVDAFLKSLEGLFTIQDLDFGHHKGTSNFTAYYDQERNVFVSKARPEDRKRKKRADDEDEEVESRVCAKRRTGE
ncbi:hypothetical protein HYALB_00001889 [Hymenoscyphus albidus]|uniref:Uncharacterized protein n=1 Tax=Hymenoscyphus albidus TaxID=595503 RepID=A0A9N9LAU3_9HELO|nr:hypothetical protein HYALB_00001889 [Hymenoscyphus albidus]